MVWQTIALNTGIAAITAGVNYLFADRDEDTYGPLQQVDVPRMTAAEPIPLVFGRVRLTSPGVLYHEGPAVAGYDESGSRVGQQNVLAALFVWCHGPIDNASRLYYGDDNLGPIALRDGVLVQNDTAKFDKNLDGETPPDAYTHAPTISGRVWFGLQEDIDFTDPDYPASPYWWFASGMERDDGRGIYGLGNPPVIGFRHVVSMSCRITMGRDTLKPVALEVVRKKAWSFDGTPWYSSKIPGVGLSDPPGTNPAHIIYECLTDKLWGLGIDSSRIDDAAFKVAADTLFDEGLHLSGVLTAETSIADFIAEILRHIDGIFYVEPTTSKFVLDLIRDDYTVADLTLLDDSNATISYTRPHSGDLPTRVHAVYSSAWGDDLSYPLTNTAAFSIRGEVSQTVRYPMVVDIGSGDHAKEIIAQIAARDLRQLSNPLAQVSITGIHWSKGKDLRPGDTVLVSSQSQGIQEMVVRITEVDLGGQASSNVSVRGVEDAFAYDDSIFAIPADSDWTDPRNDPEAASPRLAFELPIWLSWMLDLEAVGTVNIDSYETDTRGRVGLAAGSPTIDSIDYHLATNDQIREQGAGFAPVLSIDQPMSQAHSSPASWSNDVSLDETRDALVAIYSELSGGSRVEMGVLTSIDEDARTATLNRGWGDTTPARETLPAGSKIYVLGYLYDDAGTTRLDRIHSADTLARDDGTTVDLKALPSTPLGRLAMADAPTDSVTLDTRTRRPYPAGHVQIDDQSRPSDFEGQVVISWKHRDRFDEPLTDDDATSQALESGAGYFLNIYGEDNTGSESLLHAELNITSESYTYTNAAELDDNGKSCLSAWLRIVIRASSSTGGANWQDQEWRIERNDTGC